MVQDIQAQINDAILVEVQRGRHLSDEFRLAGHFHIEAKHANGEVFAVRDIPNIVTTVGKNALAAYLVNSSPTAPFMKYMEIGTKGTTTATSITGNATTADSFTVGTNITAGSPAVIELIGGGNTDVIGVTVSGTTYTAATGTVASGSNSVVLGTSSVINCTSSLITQGFVDPTTIAGGVAYAQVIIGGVAQVFSYTGRTATQFTGVQLVGAAAGTLATAQVINQNPQNSYSGTTTVTLAPLKADTANGTALGSRVVGTETAPGSVNIYQNVGVFTGYTGSVDEVGLFDASSSGNMFVHGVFGVVTIASSDTLTITYQITFS